MNIIVLSNNRNYPYHTQITKALNTIVSSNGSNAQIIDTSDKTSLSGLSLQLSSHTPEIIITLDLAGFELRTLTGECLLNMLPCKICNIIWGNKPEYKNFLSGKLSLSMLFYDAAGKDNELPAQYPYLRYYYPAAQGISTASNSNNEVAEEVYETLQGMWEHFTKEVLL